MAALRLVHYGLVVLPKKESALDAETNGEFHLAPCWWAIRIDGDLFPFGAPVLVSGVDVGDKPVDGYAQGRCVEHWLDVRKRECDSTMWDSLVQRGAKVERSYSTHSEDMIGGSSLCEIGGGDAEWMSAVLAGAVAQRW